MRIDPGALDRRLTLISNVTGADDLGQTTHVWSDSATIWAQRLEMRVSDAARGGQRDTFGVGRYLIRYRDGVTTAMRVRVDGRLWDILAVDEPDRRKSLVLMVEEVTR